MSEETQASRPKLKLGEARFEAVNAVSDQKRLEEADPKLLAAAVAERVRASEKPLSCEKRRSRRARDYWLSLLIGNLCILAAFFILPRNVAVWVYGGSGVVIFNLGLTWVMWQVMDDY